jgi:mycothiol system anti-sigma-R factor
MVNFYQGNFMETNQQKSAETSKQMGCSSCNECLQVLQIVLDGEATPEEADFVHHHIATCNHCLECYEVDKTLRQMVKAKVLNLNCPQDLAQLIEVKISELVIKV